MQRPGRSSGCDCTPRTGGGDSEDTHERGAAYDRRACMTARSCDSAAANVFRPLSQCERARALLYATEGVGVIVSTCVNPTVFSMPRSAGTFGAHQLVGSLFSSRPG